jgi:hypothetical protein
MFTKFLSESQKGRDQFRDLCVVGGKGKMDLEELERAQLAQDRVQ